MSKTLRARRISRVLGGGLAATAMAAGLSLATSGAAHADSSFTVHLSPENTFGLLLDVNGASYAPGASVIDWYANGGQNQAWTFIPDGVGGVYEIQNVNSGLCLTTDGVAGDGVYQLQCTGSLPQRWSTALTPSNPGSFSIQSSWTHLYLDVNGNSGWAGATIDTWYGNGQLNQFFTAL
jgi:hypothetical protein